MNKNNPVNLNVYSEIEILNQLVFKPCGIEINEVKQEAESQAYFAHQLQIDGQKTLFRKAKITPTKTGQFVAIWKRNEHGITVPYDVLDDFEFFIIATRKDKNFGIFIFPKTVLQQHQVLSTSDTLGKRGIRVYPSWDLTINKQSQKTQLWQLKYFLELSENKKIDLIKAKDLINFKN